MVQGMETSLATLMLGIRAFLRHAADILNGRCAVQSTGLSNSVRRAALFAASAFEISDRANSFEPRIRFANLRQD